MPERLYSPYQVANLLGVTEGEVVAWIQKGLLAVHRFPDESVRVRQRALVDFLRRQGINLQSLIERGERAEGQSQASSAKPPAQVEAPPADPAEAPQAAVVDEAVATEEGSNGDSDKTEVAAPAGSSAGQVVSAVLREALVRGAELVLLESAGDALTLRLRVGGYVYDKPGFRTYLPAGLGHKIVQYLRSLAGLAAEAADTAGGTFTSDGKVFRLDCCPTAAGQRLAIRAVDRPAWPVRLADLGMPSGDQQRLMSLLFRRGGLIVVAGPARSGRSTLLRAMAAEVPPGLDVASLERSAGVSSDLDERFDALCRQDCDVILLDDMRRRRTMQSAVAAANDGRLVIAVMRARDLGEVLGLLGGAAAGEDARWDMASALVGVISCRVARRLCEHCRSETQGPEALVRELGLGAKVDFTTFQSPGCPKCWRSGQAGLEGIYSLTAIDRQIASIVRAGGEVAALEQSAGGALLQAGIDKVRSGSISLAELARVLKT